MAATSLFTSIIFFISITFIPQSTPQQINTGSDGFAIRLIHRDSPLSPLYYHNVTNLDRFQLAAQRSISRVNYFHSRSSSPSLARDISSRLIPDNGEYLMIFSVGTPPSQVYAIADTGSDLIWLKCSPCKNCFDQPTFDPSKSSTYEKQDCDSLACNKGLSSMDTRPCKDSHEPCYYSVEYGDHSTTEGTLSYDKFAFEGPCRNVVDVGVLDFGCANATTGYFEGKQMGIIGLNRGNLSFISQLGLTKFSYCMVMADDEGSGSRMHFGSQAVMSRGRTPLVKGHDNYYITLEGISIGDQQVQIPNGIFNITKDGEGGFIVDSGTTCTMLQSEAYDALVAALRKAIHLPEKKSTSTDFELCFGGSFDDLALEPDVTFHFWGVNVTLTKQTTYFELESELWCLAILRSNYPISIFGNIQQQNFHVGYDLEANVVSFAPADCARF